MSGGGPLGRAAERFVSAQGALANDVACLTGNGEWASGDARAMTLVEVSDADFEKARGVLVDKVLPDWAERAGDEWASRWNDTVGAAVGVKIGMN